MSASAATAATPAANVRRRSREALTALAVQYVLGMAANLIGEPENTFVGIVVAIIVILHVLVAIGLVVVSVRVLLAARTAGVGDRLAVWGVVTIAVTFAAGVFTISFGSDWASFIMALGFLVAAALYVGTFLASYRLERSAQA